MGAAAAAPLQRKPATQPAAKLDAKPKPLTAAVPVKARPAYLDPKDKTGKEKDTTGGVGSGGKSGTQKAGAAPDAKTGAGPATEGSDAAGKPKSKPKGQAQHKAEPPADAANDNARPPAAVQPVTGSHRLARPALDPRTDAATFDAPRTLAVRPDTAPSATEAIDPDVRRHATVFAEAAAAAVRLHQQLAADADAGLAAARTADSRRAAEAQHDLDTDLDGLGRELAGARGALQSRAGTGIALVSARAKYARRGVRAAANSALGALSAATRKVRSDLKPARTRLKEIEDGASARASKLATIGKAAAKGLGTLAAAPDGPTGFPYPEDRIDAAANELTVQAVPPRARIRSAFFGKETGLQETFLKGPIAELHINGLNALAEFEAMLIKAETIGPAAVRQSRDTAIAQIDAGETAIVNALTQAVAASDAALVQQHNGARSQLIEAAEARGRGEQGAAEGRAGRDHGATMAMARGPALGLKALVAGMAAETERPPPQFAQVVIRASTQFRQRSAISGTDQRARLMRDAVQGRENLDRQSEAGAVRQARTAALLTGPLGQSARSAADAIADQADKGSNGWMELAKPVQDAMNGFLPPLQMEYLWKLLRMWLALGSASASFDAAFRGDPQPVDPNKKKDDKKKGEDGPQMKAVEFETLAGTVEKTPRDEEYVAGAAKRSPGIVGGDLSARSAGLDDALGIKGRTDVDKVMANLRGLTQRRGSGLRQFWVKPGGYQYSLDARIEHGLTKVFTLGRTDKHNKAAAFAHLNGDEAKAAFEEMEAAVVLWNDNDRIKDVHQSLDPANAAELAKMEGIGEIRADLNQPAGELFDIYAKVNETNYKEQSAAAEALLLKRSVDKAHGSEGEGSDDTTRRTISSASDMAGMTAIGGTNKDLDAIGDEFAAKDRKVRNEQAWQAQLKAFGERADVKAATPTAMTGADGKAYEGPGAALYAYASKSRTYTHEVTNKDGDVIRTYQTTHTVSKEQKLWFEEALKHGVHHERTVAALGLIMKRRKGDDKKDREELEEAFHDKRIDARELENPTPEKLKERQKDAEDRLKRIHELQATFENGFDGGKRTGADVTQEWQDWADKSADGDEAKAAYLKGITTRWDSDPAAAWFYAVDGAGKDIDLLKRTTKRLTREQIKDYGIEYNKRHPEGPSIKARLGIHGERATDIRSYFNGDFLPEVSGDDANDLNLIFMGTPQTPLELIESARMKTKLQYDQGRYTVGRLLASDEFDRLDSRIDTLAKQAGMSRDEFMGNFNPDGSFQIENPLTGKKNNAGNFNKKGELVPTTGVNMDSFELACTMAHLSADSYKMATDRIANYITTAIVIVAAIISTVLTFGTAASLWIPVLVTAAGGLLAMGANAAIKGGRYGIHDVGKDLAMTFVQAATAGLGAALGVVLKGGLPALRLVAGSLKVSQSAVKAAAATKAVAAAGELIETSAAAAAKRTALAALGKELTYGQQLFVGTASGAFASGATAALDVEAWREGKWGKGIGHGLLRGGLGGGAGTLGASAGSAVMGKAFGAGRALMGMKQLADGQRANALVSGITRVAGSGSAGFAQSLTEGAYLSGVQGKALTTQDIVTDAAWAAVQNAAQTVGEHGIETRRAIKQAKVSPADAPSARPVVHANDNEPASRKAPHDDAGPSAVRPGAANDAADPVARKPRLPGDPPDSAAPRPRKQPPPLPAAAKRAGARPAIVEIEFMEPGWGIMAGNPKSKPEAAHIYRNLVLEQPHLEVGVYRNTKTGEYVTFQGDAGEVHVGKGASGVTEGPQPEGNMQRWKKDLLASDSGDWELQAHYHPVANKGDKTTERWRQLPSGEDGDLAVMEGESHNRGVRSAEGHVLPAARKSRLHYMADGEFGHTDFGFDPAHSKPYWVDVAGPTPGSPRRVERFTDLADYRAFFKRETGHELAAPGPAVDPSTAIPKPAMASAAPPAERPDDYVFHHGTTRAGRAQIETSGVVAQRKPGKGEDFSAAFYVTPNKQVADDYVADRLRKAGGQPGDGAVMSFRVSKADMGLVIDIRPGGQHRAQWEAFVDGPSPFAMLGADYMAKNKLPATLGEYLVTFGHDVRGEHFEKFLAKHGWSQADAIQGDLGGKGTAGVGASVAGAEQIAIRSQRLADILSAKLGIKPATGDEAGTANAVSIGKARIAKVLADSTQSVVMPKPVEDDFAQAMRRPMTDADRAELAKPPHLRRSDPEIDAFLDRAFPADDPRARVADFHGPARDPAPTPASIARAQARAESQRLFGLYPLMMDEHLRKLDFGVTTIDETVDAFARMRKADRKADKTTADHDIKALRSVLEKQQQRIDEEFALRKSMEDQERIGNGPTKIDQLKVSDKVKAMVRQSPALFDMVNRNPALAEYRLQRMAKRFRGKNFNVKRFEQGWYDYYVSNQLVVTSEHDALFIAGKLSRTPRFPVDTGTPLDIIKGGGRGNKHGIDAIAVELPDPNAPPPKHAETHVIDDKALMADTVSSVTALTKFLEGNFRTDAAEIKARLAEHRASNIPVNPLHEMAADQLLRAADAIRTLKKQPGFAGDKMVWQNPAYAKAVQQILRDNHIHMAITSARGSVVKVSDLLGKNGYGFKLLFDRP